LHKREEAEQGICRNKIGHERVDTCERVGGKKGRETARMGVQNVDNNRVRNQPERALEKKVGAAVSVRPEKRKGNSKKPEEGHTMREVRQMKTSANEKEKELRGSLMRRALS